MALTDYRTLGRSGLAVSPLSLGTMTFGAERWGSGETGSRAVFEAYVAAGGNLIDTADVYSGGRSEEMLGRFVAEGGLRDRLVLATKAGFARERGHPLAGGNGAKNIHAALEGSLRRLQTDYVDLFWVHVWDTVTPAEEVLGTLGALVRAGKIRYFGLSNVPAWYLAKMATLAAARGGPGPIALQLEYSLVERSIEREHGPAAREFGLGILPWSPLAGGFLSGKYCREAVEAAGKAPASPELPTGGAEGDREASTEGRLSGSNPFGDSKFTARNWAVLDVVRSIADDMDRTPAEVSLAWAARQPGIASVIVGASRVEQLTANIGSLDIGFTPEQQRALEEAGAPEPVYPYPIFSPTIRRMVFGGSEVEGWRG